MEREQAEGLCEALKGSRWVERAAVRANPKAQGGFAVSVWPKGEQRGDRNLAWTTARMEFKRLHPNQRLPLRNRDMAVETKENALHELW